MIQTGSNQITLDAKGLINHYTGAQKYVVEYDSGKLIDMLMNDEKYITSKELPTFLNFLGLLPESPTNVGSTFINRDFKYLLKYISSSETGEISLDESLEIHDIDKYIIECNKLLNLLRNDLIEMVKSSARIKKRYRKITYNFDTSIIDRIWIKDLGTRILEEDLLELVVLLEYSNSSTIKPLIISFNANGSIYEKEGIKVTCKEGCIYLIPDDSFIVNLSIEHLIIHKI